MTDGSQGMAYGCPWCGHVSARANVARCAGCGKAYRLERPARAGAGVGLPAAWRPPRRARLAGHPLLMRQPALVVGVVLVLALVGGALLRRVARPPPGAARRQAVVRDNLATLRVALDMLRDDVGRYPTDAEGLIVLVHDPGMAGWRGPYILELKPDPWGWPFRYATLSNGFVVVSSGAADGMPGTAADIVVRGGRAAAAADGRAAP